MTSNVKLCCMVLTRLGFVAHGREFQRCLVLLIFCKSVIYAYCQVACYLLLLVFIARLFCPVVKDIVSCLSYPSFQCYTNRSSLLVAEVLKEVFSYQSLLEDL